MTILDEAKAATEARPESYGHPLDHFTRTAEMVTAYLHGRGLLPKDKSLSWYDWPEMMQLDKMVRRMNAARHHDSLVDTPGYARTMEMGWDELDRRALASNLLPGVPPVRSNGTHPTCSSLGIHGHKPGHLSE